MNAIFVCKVALVALLSICGATTAWHQAHANQTEQPTTGRPQAGGASGLAGQTETSQDRQLLALVRLRDGHVSSVAELRRMLAYHENLRLRLESAFNEYTTPPISREQLTAAVQRELESVKKFEADFKTAGTIEEQRRLAVTFDRRFQINLPGRPTQILSRSVLPSDQAVRFSLPRERTTLNEVFQGITGENREWSSKYERLLKTTADKINNLENARKTALDDLASSFDFYSGARSFETITAQQIQSGIDRYRLALQTTMENYQPLSSTMVQDSRSSVLAAADAVGKELGDRDQTANTLFREFEKTISNNAKSIYGNKVGADSFNYLLLVFAAVFIVIMLIPRLYADSTIAANLLKAEFLLQFSTVFVLIAAIIILGIGDLIDKDQLPVLLAGISGYVLGQLGKAGSQPAAAQPQQ